MFHISDLKKFNKCPRLYFLSLDNSSEHINYLRNDESYNDLLRVKLNIDECFVGSVGDDTSVFIKAKENYSWFNKTRFEVNELRIKIPFLHKLDDGKFDVYFQYYGTQINELDLFTYRISIEILEKLELIINDVFISYINPDYVFHEQTDPDQLFLITNKYNNGRLINIIHDSFVDYENIIKQIKEGSLDSFSPLKNKNCHYRELCKHYYDCFKDEKNLEDNSILNLVCSEHKNEMYNNNIKYLKDVDLDKLEGNRVQYAQIMADKNGGLFVDKNSLSNWLLDVDSKIISFIDFEWDRYLIPSYEGMKPFDVLPFEFALYIYKGEGVLTHKTFISNGDCRREFAKKLIEYVPRIGKVFAYNAEGAEALRIKELANLFPDLSKDLLNIADRLVDLAIPFTEGLVYDTRMAGNFSLKKLVNIVSKENYKDLNISDGMIAVVNWRSLDKGEAINVNKTIDDLKKYCSLDAYGLYLVYKWLLSLVN